MTPSPSRRTKVLIAKRFCGAVAMIENSRNPSIAIPKVLGIGVAVKVRISTSARNAFNASFWRTPKRCSSSTITRPRLANRVSFDRSLCVPIMISASPLAMASRAALISLVVLKRESSTIRTGQSAKRSFHVATCCSASRVVGARIATCLPPITAMKLARNATSVLPKPTSPQTKRSIGVPLVISPITAVIALAWSGVSSKPKLSANAS